MVFTRERTYAGVLFLLVSSLYYATLSGITCSNDGSHYALVRAIAERGQAEITPYAQFTEGNDFALVDRRVYSDRPPGTACLSALAYRAGQWLPGAGSVLPSRFDADNPVLVYVLIVPVLLGAGTVLAMFRLLRFTGVSLEAATVAACALAVGTIHWKYSSVLFSHALSGWLLFMVFSALVRTDDRAPLQPMAAAGIGLMLGASVAVEYSNALYVLLASAFVWLRRDRLAALRAQPLGALLYAAGVALPLSLLMLYHARVFGGPLKTSYSATVNYQFAHSIWDTFSGSVHEGLQGLLFVAPGEMVTERDGIVIGVANQGIFWLSPVLLFALPGLLLRSRQQWRPIAFVSLALAGYLLLFAAHLTYHAYTRDGRYFAPFLPLLAVGIGWYLQQLFARGPSSFGTLASYAGFFVLLALSIRNTALHIALSYNYHFQWYALRPVAVDPANLVYLLQCLFPNWRDLPRYWALFATLVVPALAGWKLARLRREPARGPQGWSVSP